MTAAPEIQGRDPLLKKMGRWLIMTLACVGGAAYVCLAFVVSIQLLWLPPPVSP